MVLLCPVFTLCVFTCPSTFFNIPPIWLTSYISSSSSSCRKQSSNLFRILHGTIVCFLPCSHPQPFVRFQIYRSHESGLSSAAPINFFLPCLPDSTKSQSLHILANIPFPNLVFLAPSMFLISPIPKPCNLHFCI